jgi:hypothetical protein
VLANSCGLLKYIMNEKEIKEKNKRLNKIYKENHISIKT